MATHVCDRCGRRVRRVDTVANLDVRETSGAAWRPFVACRECYRALTKRTCHLADQLATACSHNAVRLTRAGGVLVSFAVRLAVVLALSGCGARAHLVTDYARLADAVCKPGESWESCRDRCALANGETLVNGGSR